MIQHKQVEIFIASERGKPQAITAWVCTLLNLNRGDKGLGGMRCPSFHTAQDVTESIRDALGLQQLDFTTY
jgi:hypothetical protein